MNIYTKRGDSGETDLFGGGCVPKDALRVDAYGSVDELNAAIGFCIANLTPHPPSRNGKGEPDLVELLQSVQSDLFRIGAELATEPATDPEKLRKRMTPVTEERIAEVERVIDRCEEELEPLRNFILPGGSEPAARLHLARTVCRRAERRVVALAREEEVSAEVVKYLNRLSDLLFVLARVANKRAGVTETTWNG